VKTKNDLIIIILLLFSFVLNAQNQNKIWYFGNHAGLDFNSGIPIALTDGQLNTSEGCSTISDSAGNLLFYTDGISVWARNHLVMPNGTGLAGHVSTTQSALIIPMPGSIDKYYIFTIMELGGAMKYSIVDMTLNSGFGDVILSSKNTLLHNTVSEKQTAIKRCDGKIWLLSHEWGTNNFFADLIDSSGISASVISGMGTVHSGSTLNSIGSMKFSQQGDRIALAMGAFKQFEVFDFDINTGIISNAITLGSTSYNICSGVEFSPNGKLLYCSSALTSQVFQFNLMLGSASAIAASSTIVGTGVDYLCAMQLGTDGKIYVAKTTTSSTGPSSLDVINNPDITGTSCNYLSGGVSLAAKQSLAGLPNFMIRAVETSNISLSGPANMCIGQNVTLTASGGTNYQWSGGIISIDSIVTVSPTEPTAYFLTSTNSCGSDTDTIIVNVESIQDISVTGNSLICLGNSTILTATGSSIFNWSGAIFSSSSSVTVTPSFTSAYYVTGSVNSCGGDTDTIIVNVENIQDVLVTGNTITCFGDSTILTATGGSTFSWSGSIFASSPTVTVAPGSTSIYYVTGSANFCGSDTDTITVIVNQQVPAQFSYAIGTCNSRISFNNLAPGADNYTWNFGDGSFSTAFSPDHIYNNGLYNVILSTNPGTSCADSVSQVITVAAENSTLNIPNVFTPNNDNTNDEFIISGFSECKLYSLVLFNRWGQKVFETDEPGRKFWNGTNGDKKEIVEGVYYYIITVTEGLYENTGITGMVSVLR
jgi:gliding motility-associated-like protein